MNTKKTLWIKAAVLFLVIAAVLFLVAGNWNYSSVVLGILIIFLTAFFVKEIYAIKSDLSKVAKNDGGEIQSRLLHKEIIALMTEQEEFKEKKDMEAKYKDIQLRTLMNQINPHFLHNTLESIRGQALVADDLIVAEMTETLSRFFRYCISRKGTIVTLEEEVTNVNLYLKIINFRMAGKLNFVYAIDNEKLLDYHIPKLTIQPLIENALNHGIYNMKSGGTITLRIHDCETTIELCIEDNGVGISPEKLIQLNRKIASDKEENSTKQGGIALRNIHHRIQLLYGQIYGIHVYSTIGVGTTVVVSIPKVKE